jgi:hypothetical protein
MYDANRRADEQSSGGWNLGIPRVRPAHWYDGSTEWKEPVWE